jgi:hypothetical protein
VAAGGRGRTLAGGAAAGAALTLLGGAAAGASVARLTRNPRPGANGHRQADSGGQVGSKSEAGAKSASREAPGGLPSLPVHGMDRGIRARRDRRLL